MNLRADAPRPIVSPGVFSAANRRQVPIPPNKRQSQDLTTKILVPSFYHFPCECDSVQHITLLDSGKFG